jgi:benzodiazapine receptor
MDKLILFTPIVTGFLVGSICRVDISKLRDSKIRPPGWVFSIVWPILYLIIGYVWMETRRRNRVLSDFLFTMLTIALSSWAITYNCLLSKVGGLYVIVISLAIALLSVIFSYSVNPLFGILLMALPTWLMLATLLNLEEVLAP